MISEAPASVFYLDDLGSAFSENDLPGKALVLRVFRTKEEASQAKDVLGIFFGIKSQVVKAKLFDVMASARMADEHIQVILCEYDALGELIVSETLLDPHRPLN